MENKIYIIDILYMDYVTYILAALLLLALSYIVYDTLKEKKSDVITNFRLLVNDTGKY